MRFYFHMSGDGIGTLSVLKESEGRRHLLLNLTGDQGNYWQLWDVPLSDTHDFRVVFEGKVGPSPKGDICLDDITFSPGCLLSSSSEEDSTPLPPPAGADSLNLCFFFKNMYCIRYKILQQSSLCRGDTISLVLLPALSSITLHVNLICL